MNRKVIGVQAEGEFLWHARPHGWKDYETLCGLDPTGFGVEGDGLREAKRGQKITCAACRSIWEGTVALRLRGRDFEGGAA